jgi:predicted nucleic acid-binding Zn ribbon protein
MAIQRIGDLVEGSVKRAGIQQKVTAAQIIEEFKEQICERWGKQVLKRVTPKYLKRGTLTIEAKDSVFAAELRLKEKNLLDELNKKYEKAVVKKLRFLVK